MPRALPSIGRATRTALDPSAPPSPASPSERWHLPASDARLVARLLQLGAAGVGGFVAGSADATRPLWIERTAGEPTLTTWLAAHPGALPWATALSMSRSLARAAAACERAALFPGPIDPDALLVRGDTLELRADSLVAALVGGGDAARPSTIATSTRWMAPEQAAGSAADSASNRYAIGLILYRLLAGEHPFASAGLRRGLADQAARGAPPFASSLARTLPPGLQSTCLRLLDPDPSRRPRSAADIETLLAAFAPAVTVAPSPPLVTTSPPPTALQASPAPSSRPPVGLRAALDARASAEEPPPSPAAAPAPAARGGASPVVRVLVALVPIPLAIAAAVAIAGAVAKPSARGPAPIARDAPLTQAKSVDDCASCHPRHAGEWSRSVMAHATGSPLYQSLEMLIEEQVGRADDCPNGAGILRSAGAGPCTDARTGIAVTGSGGERWCVNCHAPGDNLAVALPAWNALSLDAATRRPLRDLLPASAQQGISCAFCHQATAPARPGASYEGNPSWISPATGARFAMRPEDDRGLFGIGNSGYFLDPRSLIASSLTAGAPLVAGGAHLASTPATRAYLSSSEFCGACHDVRLFGTDALEGVRRGEHFKRLRNAYSEWAAWASDERRAGRAPASCQDCHMSLFPGICVASSDPGPRAADDLAARTCPPGTRFEPVPPGRYPTGARVAGGEPTSLHTHAFTGVDVPLDPAFDARALDDTTLDVDGAPVGARARRDLLLARTFRLAIDGATRRGDRLELPILVENIGAGHRVPAGFSQEREIWLHVRVTDARGTLLYEAGRVDAPTDDLRDKQFLRVTTTDTFTDRRGRPLGLFGADVADGPDHPQWDDNGDGRTFVGRGLVNFQNGFLRCVSCIGTIDARGRCQPLPGQERARADRFVDGDYDADTGECRSNLRGTNAFLETYFPIGSLDATRGVVRGPDAIIDTRSLAPHDPHRYIHELSLAGAAPGPITVDVRLRFRAFPPYLLRAFIDYERNQDRLGHRPSGPLIDARALDRLDIVDVASARVVVP